jgi:peptidoglycan/LPS O-acetylase OafA/YrhL
MSSKYGRNIIHSLDGLRGIAALIVVERHASIWFNHWKFPNGHLAVDFFFLLSGFVLARAYDEKLRGGMPLVEFMSARVFRLYPLYLVGIVLTTVLFLLRDHQLSGLGLALAFVFLPNFSLHNFFWYVPASWSLFFELVVNSGYAAASRILKTRVLGAFCAAAAIALLAAAGHYHSMDLGYRGKQFSGGLSRVFFSFPAGVLAYRLRDAMPSIKGVAWPCAIVLVGLFLVPFPSGWQSFLQAGEVIVLFPFILLFSARAAPNDISSKVFAFLGAVSYPIYVVHGSAVRLIDIGWSHLGHHKHPKPIVGAIIILALTAVCFVLARIDDHIRRRVTIRRRRRFDLDVAPA